MAWAHPMSRAWPTFSAPPAVPITVAPAATANCTIAVDTPDARRVHQHDLTRLHAADRDAGRATPSCRRPAGSAASTNDIASGIA